MKIEKTRIKGLDSLRFIAFFCVFISHATPWFAIGYLGIDLFFVLSSFLLTYLALLEIKATNKFSKRNFFIRRSLRIYPLYLAVVVGSFMLLPICETVFNTNISLPTKRYLYLLFLSNFERSDHIFALKFLWTISVEEQFYVLFIFLSTFFRQRIFIPIILLYSLYFVGNVLGQSYDWNLYTLTTTYFPHFAGGMIAGSLFFEYKIPPVKFLIISVISTLALCMIFQYSAIFSRFIQLPISVLFACIILLTAKLFETSSMNNLLAEITEYGGKYTYGLYVYSGFVITFSTKFFQWDNTGQKLVFECIMLFMIAWISYNYFEGYFIGLKKQFYNYRLLPKKAAN